MKISNILKVFFTVFATFIVVGCGSSDSDGSGGKTTLSLNGKTPDEFYSQMEYKIERSDKYFPFHYATTLMANGLTATQGIQIPGTKNSVRVNLYLQPSHAYIMYYKEFTDDDKSKLAFNKRFEGTWHTDQMEFVIDGLGRGKGFSLNESPAINFSFAKDINAAGIAGQTIVIQYAGMTYSELDN